MKSFAALSAVVAFFEERRGRLYGFRFRDRLDWTSAAPESPIQPTDQSLGTGDGQRTAFPLLKRYGGASAPYDRAITKPVETTVRVAVGGVEQTRGVAFDVNPATGLVSFRPGHIPGVGATVTAGFAFDVPVRFDTDFLDINLEAFEAGAIPKIPLIEILL